MGVWALAMDTLSQVLVATVDRRRDRLRPRRLGGREQPSLEASCGPINDVLQTLPQLVYIIPFIYLMPVSIVPGIVAGVLYAFPVVAPPRRARRARTSRRTPVEAAGAFGATRGADAAAR